MKRQELQAEHDRLKHQISVIRNNFGASPDADELISLSCQTVCVSICGSLEQCLKEIFVEYAKQKSFNQILHEPIKKVCENYQNPKPGKILELIKLFDKDFGLDLEQSWDTDKNKKIEYSHLNNLVDNRNTIAHRKTPHVNVTIGKLDDYFKAYSGLLDRVYKHFLG